MSSTKAPPEIGITEAELITKIFKDNTAFCNHIEAEAQRRNILLLESLMEYCTDSDVDPVAAASLLTLDIKKKIEEEANTLNLLKPRKIRKTK